MKPLDPPDSMYLSAAVGWLGLGNLHEAEQELQNIAPALGEHPHVLAVRAEICLKAKNWDRAAEIAEKLASLSPDDPHPIIAFAYAMRRKTGGGIEKAKLVLEAAHQRFAEDATIPYNLACYECQLGDLDKARDWLKKACALTKNPAVIKSMALEDKDFEPLWAEIKAKNE